MAEVQTAVRRRTLTKNRKKLNDKGFTERDPHLDHLLDVQDLLSDPLVAAAPGDLPFLDEETRARMAEGPASDPVLTAALRKAARGPTNAPPLTGSVKRMDLTPDVLMNQAGLEVDSQGEESASIEVQHQSQTAEAGGAELDSTSEEEEEETDEGAAEAVEEPAKEVLEADSPDEPPPPPEDGEAPEDEELPDLSDLIEIPEAGSVTASQPVAVAMELPKTADTLPGHVMGAYAELSPSNQAKQFESIQEVLSISAENASRQQEEALPDLRATMKDEGLAPAPAVKLSVENPGDGGAMKSIAKTEAPNPKYASNPGQDFKDDAFKATSDWFGGWFGDESAPGSAAKSKDAVSNATDKLTKQGDQINTKIDAPVVKLNGAADPGQVGDASKEGMRQSAEGQAKLQEAVLNGPGPEVAQLKSLDIPFEAPPVATLQLEAVDGVPDGMAQFLEMGLPPEIQGAFDEEYGDQFKETLAPVQAEAAAAQLAFEVGNQELISRAEQDVLQANLQAQKDQEAAVQSAREDIQTQRQSAIDQGQAAVAKVRDQLEAERKASLGQIDSRVKADQQTVDKAIKKAESKAASEVKKGEKKAEAEKQKLEDEDDSWWDQAADFVCDAIDAVTDAMCAVWDAVASVVHGIIDAAVELANKVIDATLAFASEVITGFISVAGNLVADLLDDAFPELADDLREGIDEVNAWVEDSLDKLGEQLHGLVNKAGEALHKGLDKLGETVKAGIKLAGDIAKAAAKGDWGELITLLLIPVLKLAGIDEKEFYKYMGKADVVITSVLEDPGALFSNAVSAVSKGFGQFGDNFGSHFLNGAVSWITGAAGVKLPKTFDVAGVFDIATQVMGLTKTKIKTKVEKRIGKEAVQAIEFVWEYVEAFMKEGVAGLWEQLKGDIGDLWKMVVGQITDWVMEKVIMRGAQFIATLSTGIGAIVEAVIAIWNFIMWLKDNVAKLWGVMKSVIDSMHNLATGELKPAADGIEKALAGTVPVAIDLVMKMLGLGGVSKRVQKVVKGVQKRVDKGLDKMMDKAMELFKGGKKKGKKGKDGKDKGGDPTLNFETDKRHFKVGKEDHELWVKVDKGVPVIMMASANPGPLEKKVKEQKDWAKTASVKEMKSLSEVEKDNEASEGFVKKYIKGTWDKLKGTAKAAVGVVQTFAGGKSAKAREKVKVDEKQKAAVENAAKIHEMTKLISKVFVETSGDNGADQLIQKVITQAPDGVMWIGVESTKPKGTAYSSHPTWNAAAVSAAKAEKEKEKGDFRGPFATAGRQYAFKVRAGGDQIRWFTDLTGVIDNASYGTAWNGLLNAYDTYAAKNSGSLSGGGDSSVLLKVPEALALAQKAICDSPIGMDGQSAEIKSRIDSSFKSVGIDLLGYDSSAVAGLGFDVIDGHAIKVSASAKDDGSANFDVSVDIEKLLEGKQEGVSALKQLTEHLSKAPWFKSMPWYLKPEPVDWELSYKPKITFSAQRKTKEKQWVMAIKGVEFGVAAKLGLVGGYGISGLFGVAELQGSAKVEGKVSGGMNLTITSAGAGQAANAMPSLSYDLQVGGGVSGDASLKLHCLKCDVMKLMEFFGYGPKKFLNDVKEARQKLAKEKDDLEKVVEEPKDKPEKNKSGLKVGLDEPSLGYEGMGATIKMKIEEEESKTLWENFSGVLKGERGLIEKTILEGSMDFFTFDMQKTRGKPFQWSVVFNTAEIRDRLRHAFAKTFATFTGKDPDYLAAIDARYEAIYDIHKQINRLKLERKGNKHKGKSKAVAQNDKQIKDLNDKRKTLKSNKVAKLQDKLSGLEGKLSDAKEKQQLAQDAYDEVYKEVYHQRAPQTDLEPYEAKLNDAKDEKSSLQMKRDKVKAELKTYEKIMAK